jgi:hypothetical protein
MQRESIRHEAARTTQGQMSSSAQSSKAQQGFARRERAELRSAGQMRTSAPTWFVAVYENVGSFTKSSRGTGSSGLPALRQAASPPTITNALNPSSRSICATRALVASRAQVQ